jgi:hypothetical protein
MKRGTSPGRDSSSSYGAKRSKLGNAGVSSNKTVPNIHKIRSLRPDDYLEDSLGVLRPYKSFFYANIVKRIPCRVTGYGDTGVERNRHFLFAGTMKRLKEKIRFGESKEG